MKKKLSMVLIVTIILTFVGIPSFAAEKMKDADIFTVVTIKALKSGENKIKVSYDASTKNIENISEKAFKENVKNIHLTKEFDKNQFKKEEFIKNSKIDIENLKKEVYKGHDNHCSTIKDQEISLYILLYVLEKHFDDVSLKDHWDLKEENIIVDYNGSSISMNKKIEKEIENIASLNGIEFNQGQIKNKLDDILLATALTAKDNGPIMINFEDTKKIKKSKLISESNISVSTEEKTIPNITTTKEANQQQSTSKESDNSNKEEKKHSSSSHSSSSNIDEEKIEYSLSMEPSFPGAFTYDLKVSTKENENIKGYQLVYDGKIIGEDKDQDGVVKALSIFFGKDVEKSKFKILKDGKEIICKGFND